jgi:hypothetical protein
MVSSIVIMDTPAVFLRASVLFPVVRKGSH